MGTITSPQAFYGLKAIGTPTKTQVANDVLVGVSTQTVNLTGATKAYCVSATLASNGDTLTIDTATGIATVGTTPVAQVETATVVAASGATSSGNLAVTVTAARVTGSPLAFSVALVNGVDTTANAIAAKIRTAFNANAALTAVYTVGGTGADVTLTETDPQNNDATLNIAIAAGLGVSAVASSTNTTAGVGGVKLTNNTGDGKDFEGVSLGAMDGPQAVLVKNTSQTAFPITLPIMLAGVSDTSGDFVCNNVYPMSFVLAAISPSDLIIEHLGQIGSGDGNLSVEVTILSA